MEIEIRPSGLLLTARLRKYAERRLQFALAYDSWRVRRPVVRLIDLDAPNTDDQRCQIEVTFLDHDRALLGGVNRRAGCRGQAHRGRARPDQQDAADVAVGSEETGGGVRPSAQKVPNAKKKGLDRSDLTLCLTGAPGRI